MIFLVGIDSSSGAKKAFEYALHFMKPGDDLVLAYVVEVVSHPDLAQKQYYHKVEEELNKMSFEKGQHVLQQYGSVAAARGIAAKVVELSGGDAGAQLVAAAEASKADVIVVGRRRVIEAERLLLGSVSDFLVQHSPCTVVIAR
mmetsp:Transcript_10681/g.17479  ORF Transcript_10681/g.17479 Transcript_10681/m.17479 type:complete len:144 (-) Transcript_10681:383-814(-)|eukprot:CAMPEP_0184645014 /NCGR_PEP_ID=MMETSP0308-20130426/1588_1 /TAXON_ID=38269 /ORGANISM="Gloeochaete witrockiana, Strain SAG 46.84" /LENGTH=143 /DNA_ID=CAMNT_0027073795 /DNA_START=69 /DNA_END=500 /DNA_ORIENTATION=-